MGRNKYFFHFISIYNRITSFPTCSVNKEDNPVTRKIGKLSNDFSFIILSSQPARHLTLSNFLTPKQKINFKTGREKETQIFTERRQKNSAKIVSRFNTTFWEYHILRLERNAVSREFYPHVLSKYKVANFLDPSWCCFVNCNQMLSDKKVLFETSRLNTKGRTSLLRRNHRKHSIPSFLQTIWLFFKRTQANFHSWHKTIKVTF